MLRASFQVALDTRLQQAEACLDKTHVSQRQLAAAIGPTSAAGACLRRLRAQGTARANAADSAAVVAALDEVQSAALLVEGLMSGVDGMLTDGGGNSGGAAAAVFSEVEHRTSPAVRRLTQRWAAVRAASAASLAAARADVLRPLSLDSPAALPPLPAAAEAAVGAGRVSPVATAAATPAAAAAGPASAVAAWQQRRAPPPRVGRSAAATAAPAPTPTPTPKDSTGRRSSRDDSVGVGATAAAVLAVRDERAERDEDDAHHAELRAVVAEAREIRGLQEEMQRLVARQGEALATAEENAMRSETATVQAREQLSLASKYKMGVAWIGGALIGGLIGGPVGMLAGAKTAGVICASAALGGTAGAIVTDRVATGAHRRNNDPVLLEEAGVAMGAARPTAPAEAAATGRSAPA